MLKHSLYSLKENLLRRTKLLLILTVFISLLALVGCVSFKRHGKTNAAKQVYHDITSRNNGFFNANERIKKVKLNIVTTKKDDYDQILSVYNDRDPEVAKAYSADLDEIIIKTSTIIKNHEPSIWTDNAYLLVAESYFLKGDFDNALLTFQFVNTEFKQNVVKKKPQSAKEKKSKGKPQSAAQKSAPTSGGSKTSKSNSKHPMTGAEKKKLEEQEAAEAAEREKQEQLKNVTNDSTSKATAQAAAPDNKGFEDKLHMFKHEPVRPDAMIWLVDTYTELKKYKEAEAVLTIIDADEDFPAWMKLDVEVARANLFVKKGDYARAIPPLTLLTQKIKKKRKKVRYEYILAQIYERQKKSTEAAGHYQEVLDGKPLYQMSFNAKMSLARIATNDNAMPTGEVVKLLKKLLKDAKYKEFYDQVYFALAELTLKDGDRAQAIVYYKKCIESSTSNSVQKSKAYLRLGELYFEDENYVTSQPYYDSTLNLIGKDDPKKSEVNKRNSILKNLVTQTKTIHDCDSLLKLQGLSESEREDYVDKLIEKQEEEKDIKRQNEKLQFENQAPTTNPNDPSGGWYFDNPVAKGSGYNDFVKRWGNRKLEDNWRRSDKSTFDANDTTSTDKDGKDTTATKGKDGKEKLSVRDQMLKNIPSGDAEVKKLNDKIVEAYYSLANIYSIELKNVPKAIATFEELRKRYPDNKYLAETYYNLFLLYAKVPDETKSNHFKDLVLSKYPESKFAKIIRDPEYLNKEKKAMNAISIYYDGMYQLYLQGQYDTVIDRKHLIDSLYASSSLKPKFDLLIAFAIGKKQDLKAYKEALQSIVKLYPSDPAKTKAEEILRYIDKSTDSLVRIENNKLRYEYNPESKHYFMISLKSDSVKPLDVVNKVAQFNDANRALEKLKIEPLILPDGNTIVTVKSFENLAKAKDYYNAFIQSTTLAAYPKQFINYYMISDVNMNKIIINKEINSYFDFFNLKYIK